MLRIVDGEEVLSNFAEDISEKKNPKLLTETKQERALSAKVEKASRKEDPAGE